MQVVELERDQGFWHIQDAQMGTDRIAPQVQGERPKLPQTRPQAAGRDALG